MGSFLLLDHHFYIRLAAINGHVNHYSTSAIGLVLIGTPAEGDMGSKSTIQYKLLQYMVL